MPPHLKNFHYATVNGSQPLYKILHPPVTVGVGRDGGPQFEFFLAI